MSYIPWLQLTAVGLMTAALVISQVTVRRLLRTSSLLLKTNRELVDKLACSINGHVLPKPLAAGAFECERCKDNAIILPVPGRVEFTEETHMPTGGVVGMDLVLVPLDAIDAPDQSQTRH